MRRLTPISSSRHSETDQHFKTLHQTLDEYLRTGVLPVDDTPESYDVKDVEPSKVNLRGNYAHDVDLLDAACGSDDPFLGVVPLDADPSKPETAQVDTSSISNEVVDNPAE